MNTTIIDFWKANRQFWITIDPKKQKEADKLTQELEQMKQSVMWDPQQAGPPQQPTEQPTEQLKPELQLA